MSTPIPDPTELTTDALHREIAQLESSISRRFASEREFVQEKFNSVDKQLALIEDRRVEQKQDTSAAVAAALSAAKEAVNEQKDASDKSITKTETATDAQIAQLNQTIQTAIAGLVSNVNDLKERVVVLEASKLGGMAERSESRSSSTALVGMAGLILTVIIIGIAIITLTNG